jgi:hypothetical protein
MDPHRTDAEITPAPSPGVAPAPMTLREAWALSASAGLFLLFAAACTAVAFDLPALRHALDVRTLFR